MQTSKILVAVGEGRSKGYLVLPEQHGHSGALDITMFSLLMGFAMGYYAKTVSVRAGWMLTFTYHIAFK